MNIKIVNSLQKIFLKDNTDSIEEISKITAFKNERISFQIILKNNEKRSETLQYTLNSKFENITIDRVGYAPSECPVYEQKYDDNYITDQPGLFPDILYPLEKEINIYDYTNTVLWVTIDIPKNIKANDYDFTIKFFNESINITKKIDIKVINHTLEDNNLIYTQWFHADCIASHFNVKTYSKKHWELINRFMQTASRTGINMILTPLFTLPLDTEINGERPTFQLIDIKKINDKYEFDYTKLEKWIKYARKNNIHKFEFSHFFTQWGAEATPKIIVNNQKEFGWHTKANSKAYLNFLNQLLPSLINELKKMKIFENSYFHISDEPCMSRPNDLQNYETAKNILCQYISPEKIIDALSDREFYEKGVIQNPVVATSKLEKFEGIDVKWCYYCCCQGLEVSNRFFAMPSSRNRILGIQLYMDDMQGFLH